MSDLDLKGRDSSSSEGVPPPAVFERPKGFKGFYSHPVTQVCLLGFVCFMCPGLFNALNGLGAGGQVDSKTAANTNAALYSTFAAGAFFAGSINNKLGPRVTLMIGSLGYPLYIGGFLAINIHPDAGGFVIATGAILGLCAGLLWTAQGSLMLAYPTEAQKGKFIGIFWGIFNLGAVVGASVSLGQNFNSTSNSVGNGTYIGFLILTLIGVVLPWFMISPENMIRTDGTRVSTPRQRSWKSELWGIYLTMKTDPMVFFLFPMFLASNWFYTWQFNNFNGAIFNIRARSLNNFVYWTSQIVGAGAIGLMLDQERLSRRLRAFTGWSVLFIMTFVVHGWGYHYQKQYSRATYADPNAPRIDISDSGYAGRILFYIFCGLLDAMWQTTSYWLMGAMSNDPAKLANLTGLYKALQSAGAAGAWRADGNLVPYMNLFASTWALTATGLLFALPMIYLRVKEHTTLEDEGLMQMDQHHKETIATPSAGDEA